MSLSLTFKLWSSSLDIYSSTLFGFIIPNLGKSFLFIDVWSSIRFYAKLSKNFQEYSSSAIDSITFLINSSIKVHPVFSNEIAGELASEAYKITEIPFKSKKVFWLKS